MPIPIPLTPAATPPATGQPEVTASPYYAREHQGWAVEQERYRHNGALFWVGEWVMFVLMWHDVDFEHGLVERCSRCYRSGSPVQNAVAEVYHQPSKFKCPVCFGTTFEGGYRARIIRPAIMTDVEESERLQKRGETHPAQVSVETTVDFRSRNGDFLVRADNSRWRLDVPQRTTLRTGFEHPAQDPTGIQYSGQRAQYEENPAHVIYTVPPVAPGEVRSILSQPVVFPYDWSAFEHVRAPLIPASFLD